MIASFKPSWMKNDQNKNWMSSCFREKRRFSKKKKVSHKPSAAPDGFLTPGGESLPGLLDCDCHKVPQITFFEFCIPYGNSAYGCCTIIIIAEQVRIIIGPRPLFFRPPIGQSDLLLKGYLTTSCFSVSFALPDSWRTVSRVDKISSM